jgi:two-component system sensor histidine kinase ChvG
VSGKGKVEPQPSATKRLYGLRLKLVVTSLVLVSAPLVVVSFVGVYEKLYRQQVAREVRELTRELAAELRSRGARIVVPSPGGEIIQPSLIGSSSQSADGDADADRDADADPDAGVDHRDPARFIERFARDHHVMVRVLDSEGQVVRATSEEHAERWSDLRHMMKGAGAVFFGQPGPPELLAYEARLPPEAERGEVRAALRGASGERWRYAEDARMLVFYSASPMPDGRGALYITRVSRRGIRALYELRFQLLRLTGVLVLVALVMGLWIGRRWIDPLVTIQRRLADYLRNPRGNKVELSLSRRDEIGELSRHFQELVGKVEGQVEETAEVAYDLAHDMKSPIAAVETSAELLESSSNLDEDRRRRIARALSGAASHMQRSVDGLLELARLDETLTKADRQAIDMAELAEEVVEGYRDHPRAEEIDLSLVIDAKGSVLGAREQLERLLENLLDNALVFGESRVEARLGSDAGEVVLTVSDDGPGISEGNRDKVFTRFYTARPEGTKKGSGLGLAIVEAIAEAHGGSAALLDEGSQKGACFAVRLPRM